MIKIRYNHWGGVIDESNVIHKLHDQWCKDNGYRITDQVYKPGRKCGRNVFEIRQKADTLGVGNTSGECRESVAFNTQNRENVKSAT
mgnify:CR=1 FL=1